MAIIKSLRTALRLLREQPILFVPLGIFALLQIPQLFLPTLDPAVSIAASLLLSGVFLFITPAIYSGVLGMANDAASGTQTSMRRFWRHAKEYYFSILAAYILLSMISLGFTFAISLGVFVAIIAVGAGGGGLLLTAVAGGIVLLFGLAGLVALFALHFYAHAIVVEDNGAIDGLSRSVHVVRSNIKAVAGYGLLSIVLGVVLGGVFALVGTFAFPTSPTPGEPAPTPELLPALLGSVGVVVVMTLFGAFFAVFSIAFYRELVGADGVSLETDRGGDAPDAPGQNDPDIAD